MTLSKYPEYKSDKYDAPDALARVRLVSTSPGLAGSMFNSHFVFYLPG